MGSSFYSSFMNLRMLSQSNVTVALSNTQLPLRFLTLQTETVTADFRADGQKTFSAFLNKMDFCFVGKKARFRALPYRFRAGLSAQTRSWLPLEGLSNRISSESGVSVTQSGSLRSKNKKAVFCRCPSFNTWASSHNVITPAVLSGAMLCRKPTAIRKKTAAAPSKSSRSCAPVSFNKYAMPKRSNKRGKNHINRNSTVKNGFSGIVMRSKSDFDRVS